MSQVTWSHPPIAQEEAVTYAFVSHSEPLVLPGRIAVIGRAEITHSIQIITHINLPCARPSYGSALFNSHNSSVSSLLLLSLFYDGRNGGTENASNYP